MGNLAQGSGSLVGMVSDSMGATNKYDAKAPKDDFQAQQAQLQTSDYAPGVDRAQQAAVAGATQRNAAADQQAEFAQALRSQMAGNGPSLAQRQLETATQQNNAQAAGSMASQKGINPALAARMIQQNQAANNQTAAGQSATTRLNEQLSTEAQLAQALQAQRGQDIQQQQANTSLTGTLGQLQQGQNANLIQNTLGAQQIQAGVSEGNANRELGAEQINSGVEAQNTNTRGAISGTLAGSLGSVMQGVAEGGEIMSDAEFAAELKRRGVPGYENGGPVGFWVIPDYQSEQYMRGAKKTQVSSKGIANITDKFQKMLGGGKGAAGDAATAGNEAGLDPGSFGNYGASAPSAGGVSGMDPALMGTAGAGDLAGGAAAGVGAADAAGTGAAAAGGAEAGSGLVAAGGASAAAETGLGALVAEVAPAVVAAAAKGGQIDARGGGRVPGRATVPGDDPRNDTVPAVVSPGEIVLPRSVTQAPDADQKAADFVAAIKAKKKEPIGYGKVLEGQRRLESRLSRLEQMADGGEVAPDADQSLLDRVKAWWSEPKNADLDATEADKKRLDDAVGTTTGTLNRARLAAKKHNADLDAAYAASGGS